MTVNELQMKASFTVKGTNDSLFNLDNCGDDRLNHPVVFCFVFFHRKFFLPRLVYSAVYTCFGLSQWRTMTEGHSIKSLFLIWIFISQPELSLQQIMLSVCQYTPKQRVRPQQSPNSIRDHVLFLNTSKFCNIFRVSITP